MTAATRLHEAGLSVAVVEARDRVCSEGPISVVFDGTPPAGFPGIITGLFESGAAVAASALSSDERRRSVV